jgi:hypothetical protein
MASQMLASVKGMSACTTPNEASLQDTASQPDPADVVRVAERENGS